MAQQQMNGNGNTIAFTGKPAWFSFQGAADRRAREAMAEFFGYALSRVKRGKMYDAGEYLGKPRMVRVAESDLARGRPVREVCRELQPPFEIGKNGSAASVHPIAEEPIGNIGELDSSAKSCAYFPIMVGKIEGAGFAVRTTDWLIPRWVRASA